MHPTQEELDKYHCWLIEKIMPEKFRINLSLIDLVLFDPHLSWAARGLYLYLGIRFKYQVVGFTDFSASSNDNLENIKVALKQLVDRKYVTEIKKLDRNGNVRGYSYIFEKEDKTEEIVPA